MRQTVGETIGRKLTKNPASGLYVRNPKKDPACQRWSSLHKSSSQCRIEYEKLHSVLPHVSSKSIFMKPGMQKNQSPTSSRSRPLSLKLLV